MRKSLAGAGERETADLRASERKRERRKREERCAPERGESIRTANEEAGRKPGTDVGSGTNGQAERGGTVVWKEGLRSGLKLRVYP